MFILITQGPLWYEHMTGVLILYIIYVERAKSYNQNECVWEQSALCTEKNSYEHLDTQKSEH